MTTEQQVEEFLNNFKVKLRIWGLLFRKDRAKNAQTLLDLELTVIKVKEILGELEVEDYCEGPMTEKMMGGADMWVFGVIIKRNEIYIKITLGLDSAQVICISFHTAEHPLSFPFKK